MRYKHEIAYVVIVCTASDAKLFCYDPIKKHDELIDLQGLIDDDGVNCACVPSFTTKYYNTYNSYETLNFAFYFPEKRDFVCSLDNIIIHVENIRHTGCIRKFRLKKYFCKERKEVINFKEKCPDNIDDREWQLHDTVTEIESKYLRRV